MGSLSILFSAGDPSGVAYAAELARRLHNRRQLELFGVGGAALQQAGVELLGDATELAVIGLTEALSLLSRAWRLLHRLVAEAARRRPAAAVLVDFPDFNLPLARHLRALGIPVIYFIAPQVWAWRAGRLGTLRQVVSLLLVIFPFEEEFFRQHGLPVEFIGHPLVERPVPGEDRQAFLARHQLRPDRPLLALLPGSRRKELRHHLPIMLETVRQLNEAGNPAVEAVVAAAPGLSRDAFAPATDAGFAKVIQGETERVLAAADCALISSGTATVEAALAGCPMVVVYRVSPLSAWMLRRLVHTPHYSMVNLLLNRPAVPELIQEGFTAEAAARQVRELLVDSDRRQRMRRELVTLREQLRSPYPEGCLERAATRILEVARPAATRQTLLLS